MSTLRTGWTHITSDQRDLLLDLYNDGADAEELSGMARSKFGVRIKPTTLARRLREWRNRNGGATRTEKLQHRTSQKEQDNSLELSSYSYRIRSLNDLLEEFEVDLDVWEVLHHEVNSYESFRKNIDKDLTYIEGKAHGHIYDVGDVTIVPLFQVKAKLVRREPAMIEPMIQPVIIESATKLPKLSESSKSGMRRGLILADAQIGFARADLHEPRMIPFHDREALDLAVQFAESYQPDEIYIIGDWLDMTDWTSKFIRKPEFFNLTQPSIIEAAWWLYQLRLAAPKAVIKFLAGNHEDRAVNEVIKNIPAAYRLRPIVSFGGAQRQVIEISNEDALSISSLLGLNLLDIEYLENYPDDYYRVNEALRIEHGDTARANAGATVGAVLKDESESVIFGHTHRFESASRTFYQNEEVRYIEAHNIGCLCRLGAVVPGAKKNTQWQQGLAFLDYDPEGEDFHVTEVRIRNGRALFDGQIFQARRERDIVKLLREDTGKDY